MKSIIVACVMVATSFNVCAKESHVCAEVSRFANAIWHDHQGGVPKTELVNMAKEVKATPEVVQMMVNIVEDAYDKDIPEKEFTNVAIRSCFLATDFAE